jgi:hypothetical protein
MSEPFDADQPIGKLMETLLEALAEFYSANLAIETKKGQRQNALRGWHNGGNAPYGFELATVQDEKGQEHRTFILADPSKVETVQHIYQWYTEEGLGIARVAKRLNDQQVPSPQGKSSKGWTPSVIHRILRNPSYTGARVWNQQPRYGGGSWNPREEWIVEPDAHPPIITSEIFEKVQEVATARKVAQLSRRSDPGGSTGGKPVHTQKTERRTYNLSGLVQCGQCGSNYIGDPASRLRADGTRVLYRRYVCIGHKKRKICTTHLISADVLEGAVARALLQWMGRDPANRIQAETILAQMAETQQVWRTQMDALMALRAERKGQADKILDLLMDMGASDLLKERLNTIQAQLAQADLEIGMHKESAPPVIDEVTLQAALTVWRNIWSDALSQRSWDEVALKTLWWKNALRQVIEGMTVSADQTTVEVRFSLPIELSAEQVAEWVESWEGDAVTEVPEGLQVSVVESVEI